MLRRARLLRYIMGVRDRYVSLMTSALDDESTGNEATASEATVAEQLLEASEKRFRSAFDDSPVAMTITEVSPGVDRVIREANQAMADLLGYSISSLVGKSFVKLTHPEDLEADDLANADLVAGRRSAYDLTKRYVRKDGSPVWVQLHIGIVSSEPDQLMTIGHAVDITSEIEANEARRRAERFTNALSNIRMTMLRGADREEGLRLVCESASECLDAEYAMIASLDGSGTGVRVEASNGIAQTVLNRLEFSTELGNVGRVFQTGKPMFTSLQNQKLATPENVKVVEEYGVGSTVIAPMTFENRVVGVLLIAREQGKPTYGEYDLEPVLQFAAGAVAAIQFAASREAQGRLHLHEQRERIGRDMHDKAIGRLVATRMRLEAELESSEQKSMANACIVQIDQAIEEIRAAVYGVRSDVDWGHGARGEMLAIVAEVSPALGFEPTVSFEGAINRVPAVIVEAALAVLREGLTNCAKYANAETVTVRAAATQWEFSLQICDDGGGLEATREMKSAAFAGQGIPNIIRRAEEAGGHATVTSASSGGTRIEWTVPIVSPNE